MFTKVLVIAFCITMVLSEQVRIQKTSVVAEEGITTVAVASTTEATKAAEKEKARIAAENDKARIAAAAKEPARIAAAAVRLTAGKNALLGGCQNKSQVKKVLNTSYVFCKCSTHTSGIDKLAECVDNKLNCGEGDFLTTTGSCNKCSFWYWQQETAYEGTFCDNKWWLWVAFFGAALLFLVLVVTAVMACTNKKQYRELHGSELYLSGYEKTHGDYY